MPSERSGCLSMWPQHHSRSSFHCCRLSVVASGVTHVWVCALPLPFQANGMSKHLKMYDSIWSCYFRIEPHTHPPHTMADAISFQQFILYFMCFANTYERLLHYVIRHFLVSFFFSFWILCFSLFSRQSSPTLSSSRRDADAQLPVIWIGAISCCEHGNEANGNRRNDLYVCALSCFGASEYVRMMSAHQTNLRRRDLFTVLPASPTSPTSHKNSISRNSVSDDRVWCCYCFYCQCAFARSLHVAPLAVQPSFSSFLFFYFLSNSWDRCNCFEKKDRSFDVPTTEKSTRTHTLSQAGDWRYHFRIPFYFLLHSSWHHCIRIFLHFYCVWIHILLR